MRLWHQKLIPRLPDCKSTGNPRLNQLGGQHRECCAMRGGMWGRNHSTVNYVWGYGPAYLVAYHLVVMDELKRRGFELDRRWRNVQYRGPNLLEWGCEKCNSLHVCFLRTSVDHSGDVIYPEHDEQYLRECLNNLKEKGVDIGGMFHDQPQ